MLVRLVEQDDEAQAVGTQLLRLAQNVGAALVGYSAGRGTLQDDGIQVGENPIATWLRRVEEPSARIFRLSFIESTLQYPWIARIGLSEEARLQIEQPALTQLYPPPAPAVAAQGDD